MDTIIYILNKGWVSSLIGLAGIAVGIIISYIVYRVSIRGPRPTYFIESYLVLDKDAERLSTEKDKITIQFGEVPVQRLVKSIIYFWNMGNQNIMCEHIVPHQPLRISVENEGTILKATVLKTTNDEVINFKLADHEKEKNIKLITFYCLGPKDGATIEILHTSKSKNPRISGCIAAFNGIVNINIKEYIDLFERITSKLPPSKQQGFSQFAKGFVKILQVLLSATSFSLGIIMLSVSFATLIFKFKSEEVFVLLLFLAIGILLLICAYFLSPFDKSSNRNKYPKSLDITKK